MDVFLIGPAGSNMSYLESVFRGIDITPGLSYHHNDKRLHHTANLHHTPIDDKCIKIYFDKFLEIIILNWHYKLRIFVNPNDKRYTEYGPEWELSQKQAWESYGDNWEIRAVLRSIYLMYNNTIYSEKIATPGKNFNGCCLYEGFEESRREFAKFGVDYTEKQYDQWRDSQRSIISVWKNMDRPNFLHGFEYDFEKGVYIGLYGIKNNKTEDQAWQHYIK